MDDPLMVRLRDGTELWTAVSGTGPPAVCLHGKDRGTVSSSLLALRQPLSESIYLHAPGPPDSSPYEDYSHLFRQLGG